MVRLVKDDDQEELFAHIGFGNLNSLRFTVTRLHRESGEQMHAHLPGTLALRCHSLQSLNAYKFVQGVDTDWFAGWRGQLLRVDTKSDRSVPTPFRADVLLAKPFVPDVSEVFWPLPEKLKKINIRNLSSSSRSTRARTPLAASNVPLQPVEDEQDGDVVGPLADEADLWGDGADEDEWSDDADAGDGARAESGGRGGGGGGGGPGPGSAAEGGVVQQQSEASVLAGPRLGRGETIIGNFGPHPLIRLKAGGLSIWCGRHSSCTDSYKCRADLTSSKWSEDEIVVCLKRWVCRGYSLEEDEPLGRDEHKALGPARAHYDRPLTHEEVALMGHVFSADDLEGV